MRLMTKGGRPLKKSNADPQYNRCATIYFYKTFNGRTEIRIYEKTQNSERKWVTPRNGKILKSIDSASKYLADLLSLWDK